jgi:hypothetical protein
VDPKGVGTTYTEVGDGQSIYTLTPAPTNAYNPQIDSLVTVADTVGVTGPASAPAVASASPVGVPLHRSTSASAARVPQESADSLFTALAKGTVDAAELVIVGGGAEQAVGQGLAVETSTAASVQTDLDRLLWGGGGETDWLDGKCQWLP